MIVARADSPNTVDLMAFSPTKASQKEIVLSMASFWVCGGRRVTTGLEYILGSAIGLAL